MTCCCDTIGAPQQIRLCVEHHRYFWGDRKLISVSEVIRTLIPTDYSAVDPGTLEHARLRGEFTDRYLMQYILSGDVTLDPKEFPYQKLFDDVVDRLGRAIAWWDRSGFQATGTQVTVWNVVDGIAGTLDIEATNGNGEKTVIDLKCVSSLQPSYILQLGAYLAYGGADQAAILHVTKDKVRLVDYNARDCWTAWTKARDWFLTLRTLTA